MFTWQVAGYTFVAEYLDDLEDQNELYTEFQVQLFKNYISVYSAYVNVLNKATEDEEGLKTILGRHVIELLNIRDRKEAA